MPASLDINSYPLPLYTAIESVLLTERPARFSFDDTPALKRNQLLVYGLRKALIAASAHPLSTSAAKITTRSEGTTLIILHADSPEAFGGRAEVAHG